MRFLKYFKQYRRLGFIGAIRKAVKVWNKGF